MTSYMDSYPSNDMVMSVWALSKLKAPGRGQVLAKLGRRIAFDNWLSSAPQGPDRYSNSNLPSKGLKAKDVAHLLWTFADDRAAWVPLTGRSGACKVVCAFLKKMVPHPDSYHPGDLCRALYSLQHFSRRPLRGVLHILIASICSR